VFNGLKQITHGSSKYDTTGRYADHPQEIHDLLSKLHFDTAHGQIWFDEYRMLLLHTSIMGYLRKDLAHDWA
jgi:hypothetical protein